MTRSVGEWLKDFGQAMAAPGTADWSALFDEECYWRDLVALTWSIETMEGRAAIADMVATQQPVQKAAKFSLDDPALQLTDETQGWFTFETATARCRGHVQLADGKARVLMTAIVELIGHEEPGGPRRWGLARTGQRYWCCVTRR